jgi:YggT family protein
MGAFKEILDYLLQIVFSSILVVVLIRLLLQQARADFYNPVSQFVVKVSSPLLQPLRRVIPSLWGIDMAAVVLLLLVQVLAIVTVLLLNGYTPPNPLLLALWAIIGVAGLVVNFYFFALLAMIILSWVAPGSGNPAVHLIYQLTEPVMAPFRRLLPGMGGLDLSPIFVFIAINIIQIFLRHAAASVGLHPGLVMGL